MNNPHRHIADRILHGIDADTLDVDQKIALAHAHAAVALVDEAHTRNLIALFRYVSQLPPLAKAIILASARRRLGLLPPTPDEDNVGENGGV